MNLVGKVIGNRYEMLEKIGEGGMATVYKARCNILKRYVAVKVLREEFTTDEEFIRRFNTEAQAAASLTHPNIVSIFDVGHEDNVYYIVMELVQGKTLKKIINEDGVLPWKWSVNIAIQVASALETAHKNNIVHRDIKPHTYNNNRRWNCQSNRLWNSESCIKFNNYCLWNNNWFSSLFLT